VFRMILHELLATTAGAVAAMFLDYEGETVELVCDRDLDDHTLRIVGAYQGIFLTRLRELCMHLEAGAPQRYKIDFAEQTVLSSDLKDGYYLVLLADATLNEGVAWRKIEKCRERLLAEM
jgi:predicted regulator of Ras-like GTPase activity (Roadblock/LC7/MglB family)